MPEISTQYHLGQTLADVSQYLTNFDNPDKVMGNDVEASANGVNALNTRLANLTGIALSLKQGTAIYCPVGHKIGTNLPLSPVIEMIKKKEAEGYRSLFWYAQYDKNVYQKNTGWAPCLFTDVMELVYLQDPDRKDKKLKVVTKEELGKDPEKFMDLFTPEEIKSGILDISTKSPQRCRDYACADADNTLSIRYLPKFRDIEREFEFAVKVDTRLIDVVRKMEHNGGMRLNREYIDKQVDYLKKLGETLAEMIWRVVGYKFDINSPKQLGIALFDRMGLPSQGMTSGRNPQYKTGAEDLERLATTFPIAEYVLSYRKVTKAGSTYFAKLQYLDSLKIPIRFRFNIYSAPTFRFAAPGGDPLEDGATGVNIQAVSNGELRDIVGVDLTMQGKTDDYGIGLSDEEILINLQQELNEEEQVLSEELVLPNPGKGYGERLIGHLPYILNKLTKDKDGNEQILPVCIRETCKGCPASCQGHGIDTTRRLAKNVQMIPSVREAFQAPEGYTMVSLDYDRQELVIGANLSGEPSWIKALKEREDLHVKTAAGAYGMSVEQFKNLPEQEYEEKRGIGKIMNFLLFYGGNEFTLSRKANLAVPTSVQIFEGFKSDHPVLFGWIHKVHAFARKNGYTTTYFGRRRWLKKFYETGDKGMIAFANRSAVNTAIQGTGAEVTRIAMVKVDNMLKQEGYTRKEVYMCMQLHDALSFMILDELVNEITPKIRDKMAFNVKSWPVQLTVDGKAGKIWGRQRKLKLESPIVV